METATTFKFSELSERAKQKARENFTSPGYLDYEWWDFTYEDALHWMAILGITVESRHIKPRPGSPKGYEEPKLYFSGFSSQGDGACFEGRYYFNADALATIERETRDEELIRIARELAVLQLSRRIQGRSFFSAQIMTSGNYCHSHTMQVELSSEGEDDEILGIENEVLALMRDVADWVYKSLEEMHDWLYSDEYVDEQLGDKEFDENGVESNI